MLRRAGVFLALLFTLSAIAWAAPPPPCDCDYCVPNPEAKCKLPQGGVTTCGVFMRSGICLGQASSGVAALGTAPAGAPIAAATPAANKSVDSTAVDGLAPEWMKPAAAEACSCKDQCRRDRDCRRVCGSLGGEGVQVNSCCTACWCFG